MADAADIATIKSQTLSLIKDLTLNPKPNYMIDGQMVSWGNYLAQLRETVKWCDEMLAATDPFEVQSYGYTA
jgi:hypothetical protein